MSEANLGVTGPGTGAVRATVLALVADLLFDARIRAAAAQAGTAAVTVRRGDELVRRAREGRASLILVDVDAPGADAAAAISRLKADPVTRGVRVVAYVSHVNTAATLAARAAGADRVLARSAFVRELPSLMRTLATGTTHSGEDAEII